jgi:hypothetical protein
MLESPEAVLLYVPLMTEVGMSWKEIKETPRWELNGILSAYYEYKQLHSMDGYTDSHINDMAKHDPTVRAKWNEYQQTKRKYEELAGMKRKPVSFSDLM